MLESQIAKNVSLAKKSIFEACAKSGRNPEEVQLLAATKSQQPEAIRAAINAGVKICGENYVQEAERKISGIGRDVQWHFIGHLQGNKARKAVELFDCIQAVDSVKLAGKISDAAERPFPVFIEVNIAEEKSKFGAMPGQVAPVCAEIRAMPNLAVKGLFCMASFGPAEQTRLYFQKMGLLARQLGLKELSMGMSNDYAVAVEEGSTMVRIGTALFGERKK